MMTPIWNGKDKPITYLRNYKNRGEYFSLPEDREHEHDHHETLGSALKDLLSLLGFVIILLAALVILD
jgi:hypothetical protein